jgi:DNA-directed RNA polymerase subunit M/transcription elongation factor TFIIS
VNISPKGFSALTNYMQPDSWAVDMKLKVDGRPFSLEGREYVCQVIRDTSREIVIPKAAQMAFTVTFITRSLHWILERRWNHLYLLPIKTGAIPFVQARIDPILQSNAILEDGFQAVDNRLHKQSRDGVNLYIRGTNIDRELQEIPVDAEVWDERDRMVEDNLEDARHRMDGSKIQRLTMLSTPTVPGHGIDSDDAWWASDQHRWEVPCPGCKRFQVLTFDENLQLGDKPDECVLECTFCKRAWKDHERAEANSRGRWVATNLDGALRGYHISQFNSPTQTLNEIVKGWYAGQRNARKLRSFYNNNLGQPYVAAGDRITEQLLDQARGNHQLGGIPMSSVAVGIDIGGSLIHMIALHADTQQRAHMWQMQIFREWHQVDNFLASLGSFVAVIDAHPEKRAARDLALKYHGKVWLGFEADRPETNEIVHFAPLKFGEAGKATIDRTMAFDQVIKDFLDGKAIIPVNARDLGEQITNRAYNGLYYQMIQMVRVEEEDARGRIVARWKKNRNQDHWHHSYMFARMALERTPTLVVPREVQNAFARAGSLVG